MSGEFIPTSYSDERDVTPKSLGFSAEQIALSWYQITQESTREMLVDRGLTQSEIDTLEAGARSYLDRQ